MKFRIKTWILEIVLCLILSIDVNAENRPKVALVLSGGGAKGVAHIGVLKVLDEIGVPIDMVVGTSMGAIVGGLYAIGYTPNELDSLVRIQNWVNLLSNKVERDRLQFSQKEQMETYLLSMPLSRKTLVEVPSGFLDGQNIYNFFMELTVGYHEGNFSELPLPYACVATNLVTGKEIVLQKGNLPLSMRASMAIPGIFSPVIMGDDVLVDGGVLNNFPTDIARNMGADIIIGVDVSAELSDTTEFTSLFNVIDRLTSMTGLERYEKNLKLATVYIRPRTDPYTAASFETAAIDTLIRRGEMAAIENMEQLFLLKRSLGIAPSVNASPSIYNKFITSDSIEISGINIVGIDARTEQWVRRRISLPECGKISMQELNIAIDILYGTGFFSQVNYRLDGHDIYELVFILKLRSLNRLNFGFRFDSEEMAAVLVNTVLSGRPISGVQVSFTGRLGLNPYGRLDAIFGWNALRRFRVSYEYRYNDIDIYNHGSKRDNFTFSSNVGEVAFSDIYLLNWIFELCARYKYFDFNIPLYARVSNAISVESQGIFSYIVSLRHETFDRKYFPSRGMSIKGEYSLVTPYGGETFSAISWDMAGAISILPRIVFLPRICMRILASSGEVPFAFRNFVGGAVSGRYFRQQISFLGIRNVEIFEKSVIATRWMLRYNFSGRHFLSLRVDYAKQQDDILSLPSGGDIWGIAAGYSYSTIIGPIDLWLDFSNWDKKIGAYFNLGYYF